MTALSVIICSYGPRKATHKAVRRMRAMLGSDDQLLLYAGTRMGIADAGKTKQVEAVDAVGQAGLLAALDRSQGRIVMHVTDGMTLSAGTLRKLVAKAEQTGKLVVPWTNDIGTDHYAGALPVEGNVVPALTEVGRRMSEDQVARVIRPTCVVGTRSQLVGLVPYHLSYPTTIMRLVYEDCIVAGGAVAAHDGSADTRLAPPEGPDGRPLLVASMIVRDEEDFLPDCLRSLEGLVDRIDLCDTGSTDRTLEIAREFGCNVIERPWRDDFGWARNEVLDLAGDAWYSLWIDADERIIVEDVERARRQLATSVDHFESFAVSLTSPTEGDDLASTLGHWTTTRILSPQVLHYRGALHEQVVRRDGGTEIASTTIEGVTILHLGYSPEVIASRDKTARNLAIAETMYRERPDDPVAALQFARSLTLAGAPSQERIDPLRRADEGYGDADARTQAFVKGLLSMTLADLGEHREAVDIAQAALDLVPAEDSAFRALLVSSRALGQPELALERLDTYAHGPSLPPAIHEPTMRAESRAEAVRMLLEDGQVQDALTQTHEVIAEGLRHFPHWDPLFTALLETLPPEQLVEQIHHLVQSTPDGSWARPLATKVRHDIVLPLIVAHVEAVDTPDPQALQVGVTIAMIREDEPAFRRLAKHVAVLVDTDRAALASRLRERGREDLAALVAPPAVQAPAAAPTFKL